MTDKEIRQILAIMSMIVLGVMSAFYVIAQPMPLVEFLAVCSPFIGCVTWFYKATRLNND